MPTDFRSEMTSWREVFTARRASIAFFVALMTLLVTSFFVTVWQLQAFSAQFQELTGQVQLIAEVNEGLPEDQVNLLRESLLELDGVGEVEYRSQEDVIGYIDDRLFSEYSSFLQKYQLDVPVRPVFLIGLEELGDRDQVLAVLEERFSQQIFVDQSALLSSEDSFAAQFLQHLEQAMRHFQFLTVVLLLLMAGLSGYMTAFILSERSMGFHLQQLLHLSPAYTFGPAVVVSTGLSALVVLLGAVISAMVLGQFLWVLTGLLLGVLVLLDLIVVWFGRYVAPKMLKRMR